MRWTFITGTLASEFGAIVGALSAPAHCSADLAGLVGMQGRNPRLSGLSLTISLQSPSPAGSVQALRQAWLTGARCI